MDKRASVGGDPRDPGEGQIVTVLLTDIVGSTAIVREIGNEAWRERQTVHHLKMRDHLNVFRGREIKTTGDGLLAVFDRPAKTVVARRGHGRDLVRVSERHHPCRSVDRQPAGVIAKGSGIELEDAGEHELKGLPGVRRIFRLER